MRATYNQQFKDEAAALALESDCPYRQTHEEAKRSIFWYIESYYNRIRRHSGIDYMSPRMILRKRH